MSRKLYRVSFVADSDTALSIGDLLKRDVTQFKMESVDTPAPVRNGHDKEYKQFNSAKFNTLLHLVRAHGIGQLTVDTFKDMTEKAGYTRTSYAPNATILIRTGVLGRGRQLYRFGEVT